MQEKMNMTTSPQRKKISIMGETSPTARRLATALLPQPNVARQSTIGALAVNARHERDSHMLSLDHT
jgi:hypothetical protein